MTEQSESQNWTREDFKEFERLVILGESRNQMDRIRSRTGFGTFMQTHSKEQCDSMFKALCDRDK